jgi:hypothetical protein
VKSEVLDVLRNIQSIADSSWLDERRLLHGMPRLFLKITSLFSPFVSIYNNLQYLQINILTSVSIHESEDFEKKFRIMFPRGLKYFDLSRFEVRRNASNFESKAPVPPGPRSCGAGRVIRVESCRGPGGARACDPGAGAGDHDGQNAEAGPWPRSHGSGGSTDRPRRPGAAQFRVPGQAWPGACPLSRASCRTVGY